MSSLSETIKNLIKARSECLKNAHCEKRTKRKIEKTEQEMQYFVENMMMIKNEEEKMQSFEISQFEMQQFAQENDEMIKMMEEEEKEVAETEYKTAEILELLSLLVTWMISSMN